MALTPISNGDSGSSARTKINNAFTEVDAKVTAAGGSIANTVDLNASMFTALNTKVALTGDAMTGLLQFTGTTHAGLRLNNLTTVQRDAIASPQAGMAIWNTTAARLQLHNGSAWTAGMVRLDGDTMTGALTIGVGTLATTGLRLTQTWNAAATTCRAFEVAVTATAAAFAADSTIARFLGGASATTPIFSVLNTGTAWFDTASGHAIQMGVSNNLPRLVASFSGTNRSAILFNAGSGASPLLLSTSGDCLFGRGAGLDNVPTLNTAFRGFAGSHTALTFTFSATNKDESGAYTGAGHNVELVGGRGSTQSTGAAGGGAALIGGAAAGSGNNNGGNVTITGGAPTGSGTRGTVSIAANAADTLGFYGVTPIARAVLATGAGATVDNVITALQNIGLVKQA